MDTIPNKLTSTNEDDAKDYLLAVQLAGSSIFPMVLRTAIELDVFEIIARAGKGVQISAKEIASQIPTSNPNAPNMLDRMLRVLAGNDVLTSSVVTAKDGSVETLYGLGSVCKYYVRNEEGFSVAGVAMLVQDKVFMDSWYQLKAAIIEGGIPFNRVHGVNAFELPAIDHRFNQVFNEAMLGNSTIIMKKLLETYKGFEDLKQLVDVGGGVGVTIRSIISKYPTLEGINFDLPHVIEHAPSYPDVKHVGGDMFAHIPYGESILLKWILHDWSDEKCAILLKNCHNALPDHGKLIIIDGLLPQKPENSVSARFVYQNDLIMLTQNLGGRERTELEFKSLVEGAGFGGLKKVCLVCNVWVMECYKM